MELAQGVVIRGTYRLEHELGRGSMGSVWLATHLTHHGPVAIKVMNEPAGGDTARFALEAQTLAAATSPHVVRVSDFGTCEAGEPFFAMEVLQGHDLKEHIEAYAPLPLADVLTLLQQVGGALDEVHRAQVVHRDIKPANIFVVDTPDGSLFAKVLDFGVAKHMDAGLGMTATGMMVGTPYYASPEQLIDPRSVDHRTDLWSLAVVAYACLTGQLPFVADNLTNLCLMINGAQYTPPTELRPDLPPAVDGWMQRALQRDPNARFATAVDLAAGFHHAMQHQPDDELALATMMMTSGGATLHRSLARPAATSEEPTLGTLALEPAMSTVALASTLAGMRTGMVAPARAAMGLTPPHAAPTMSTVALGASMTTAPAQPLLASHPSAAAVMDTSLSPTTQSAGFTPGSSKPRRSALGWVSAGTVLLFGGLAATWWWQRPSPSDEATAPVAAVPADGTPSDGTPSDDEPAPSARGAVGDTPATPAASSSGDLPTSDGAAPSSTAPSSTAPSSTAPSSTAPSNRTPNSTAPRPRLPVTPPRPAPRPPSNNNPFGGKRL